MQALLTDIELDIQELKCLMDAIAREPNAVLREVAKRNILQMHAHLDALLAQLDVAPNLEKKIPEVKESPILAERIKPSTDLCRLISLNDSFRFSRELFGGDSELMNRMLQQVGEMSSFDTALIFVSSKINVDKENEAMADFLELLKKYFN